MSSDRRHFLRSLTAFAGLPTAGLLACLALVGSCATSTTPALPASHPASSRAPEGALPDTSGVLKPDAQDQPYTANPEAPGTDKANLPGGDE